MPALPGKLLLPRKAHHELNLEVGNRLDVFDREVGKTCDELPLAAGIGKTCDAHHFQVGKALHDLHLEVGEAFDDLHFTVERLAAELAALDRSVRGGGPGSRK